MELSIASHNGKSLPADDQHKDKQEGKENYKKGISSFKQAMPVSATLVKITEEDW